MKTLLRKWLGIDSLEKRIQTEGRENIRLYYDEILPLRQFLENWIPAVVEKDGSQHIHFYADRSSGPNWRVLLCRCGDDKSGPI